MNEGRTGSPSRSDFYTYDMLEIRDRFAQQWDAKRSWSPAGRTTAWSSCGRLGITYAVEAQLTRDGYIELLSLEVDTVQPVEPDSEPGDDDDD